MSTVLAIGLCYIKKFHGSRIAFDVISKEVGVVFYILFVESKPHFNIYFFQCFSPPFNDWYDSDRFRNYICLK
uniref:Uncharacterized protein n=1 Tax=Arundo donax TaxID=35708 RepID=A0A0A9BVQ4_ARUDO